MSEQPRQVPVAIVGVSAIFPGSVDETGFWRDILEGRDLITDVPPSHWLIEDYYDPDPSVPDMTYAKRGAFLKNIDFDALGWGVPPSILSQTDTVQLLALVAAQRVLEDASRAHAVDKERTSVILGITSGQDLLGKMVSRLQHPIWRKSLREMGLPEDEVEDACRRIASHYAKWEESTFPGLLGNVVAGRIANRLDLGGTNCVTDAACASSFSAISMAVNELTLHQADLVISGGCDTMNDIFMYMCFSKTPALSKSGECAPFSDKADGTLLGEGFGMVALKRLADAERDGDRIYAVLNAVGSSSDGRSKSVYAPRSDGQAKAILRAYDMAGFSPTTVELVEAHGTGTVAGDAAEFGGLELAFAGRDDKQWCALGTVKSQIGHTKAAAGAAGLFKAVMALHNKVLPPTLKIHKPNPKLDIENTPFYLNTETRPWIRGSSHPRRAGVSSFGFGGSNFHLALEEYTGPAVADRIRALPSELVVLTAADPSALAARIRGLLADLRPGMLGWLAHRSASEDKSLPSRLAIVVDDEDALRARLTAALTHLETRGDAPLDTPNGLHIRHGASAGPVALLFPGQGAQYVNMGAGLAIAFDAFRSAFDRAADLDLGELPLHEVVYPVPVFDDASRDALSERLTRTEWAQPAIGAHSLGALAMARELGLSPVAVGGHSFGEIVALHAAGSLSADDTLRVARRRGELMAEAARLPGAMLAVPRPVDEVRAVLAEVGGQAVVANHNSPNQVVVSGPTDDVARVEAALIAKGVEPKRLTVATAFHSSVVAESSGPFAAFLDEIAISAPTLAAYANSEAAPYPADPAAICSLLAGQIARPVRFVEQIEAMYAAGVRTFVECGPSNVLTALVGAILGDRPHLAVSFDRRRKADVTALQLAVAQLVTHGHALELDALWKGYRAPVDPRAVVPPKMVVPLSGANHGQPYPPPNGAAGLPKPNGPRPLPAPQIIEREVRVEVPVEVPVYVHPEEAPMSNPSRTPGSTDLWVHAFAEAQRQTAEAHAAYQHAMATSHQSYLRTVETSFATLSALATGAPVAWAPSPHDAPALPAPTFSAPSFPAPTYAAPQPVAAPAPPVVAPVQPVMASPQPVAAPAPPAAPVAAPKAAPVVAAPVARAASLDLKALLMDVVADKTGYPAEMLNLGMTLEGDLGIDSIKRVEILSAMREREPALPEVDAGEMAALSTLGEIVAYMDKDAPKGAPVSAPSTPAAKSVGTDLKALLMDVVADKTGYPAEMLNLGMTLEGDLGIDSIKRVEILSAMREREPALPEVDAGEMAALSTLGEIVAYMGQGGAANPPEAHPAPAATEPVVAGLGRFALELVDAPAMGLSLPGLDHTVWVTGHDAFGPALVDALTARGVDARFGDAPDDAKAVVLLSGLGDATGPAAGRELARDAFALAHRLAPSLSRGGLFVTVQDTGGDFGLAGTPRAWLGSLPGLTKTAHQEWPEAHTKAIDIATAGRAPAEVAEQLADELLFGGAELEVALTPGARRALRSVRRSARPGELSIDASSVVVVSGGGRGVTAATVVALARASKAAFVLLGRTPLAEEPACCAGIDDDAGLKRALLLDAKATGATVSPAALGKTVQGVLAGREVRATLDAIALAGGRARYVPVDVANAERLSAELATVREAWGPIAGLIHGAGVLADKTIAEKTQGQFDAVFDTKIRGLEALLTATAADPLKLVILFSSVAARCGNQGQCDYAMANEVLNKVAHHLRVSRPGCVVKSLGWGPWEGGMVTPALKARFESLGVPLIPLPTGARMLVDEAADRSGDDELVLGGEPRAEALAAEHTGPVVELAVKIDRAGLPWLADHQVAGHAVVPVVQVLEWFARAARAARPDLRLVEIGDVKVLRGIKLPDLDRGAWARVRVAEIRNGTGSLLSAELTIGAQKHYTATVTMQEGPARPRIAGPSPALGPWTGDVYDGDMLFHGPDFQVIRRVNGIGDPGIEAELTGTRERNWSGEWRTDAAALDGGLQLALLWSKRALGGASLPTAVGRLRTYADGPADGPLTCVARGEKKSSNRAVLDLVFKNADGSVYAELEGVETHLRPA